LKEKEDWVIFDFFERIRGFCLVGFNYISPGNSTFQQHTNSKPRQYHFEPSWVR